MRKFVAAIAAIVLVMGVAGSAMANGLGNDNPAGNTTITNNNTANGGQGGAGGSATSHNTNTNVNSNTNVNTNVNTQGQQQGQAQGQKQNQRQFQGQGQGQSQDASNQGVSQTTKFEAPMIPAAIGAPGLAAVGSYGCLGSFSIGLAGPMAGATFGKTVVDKGCEHARDAVVLWSFGFRQAAVELLGMNEDTRAALVRAGVLAPLAKSKDAEPTAVVVGPSDKVETP
jgi:hypothetical protein